MENVKLSPLIASDPLDHIDRSTTQKNILLDVEQSTTANDSNISISTPLSCSSPNEQLTVMENSNMNNQMFNPIVNDNVKLPPFWISCPQAWISSKPSRRLFIYDRSKTTVVD